MLAGVLVSLWLNRNGAIKATNELSVPCRAHFWCGVARATAPRFDQALDQTTSIRFMGQVYVGYEPGTAGLTFEGDLAAVKGFELRPVC